MSWEQNIRASRNLVAPKLCNITLTMKGKFTHGNKLIQLNMVLGVIVLNSIAFQNNKGATYLVRLKTLKRFICVIILLEQLHFLIASMLPTGR